SARVLAVVLTHHSELSAVGVGLITTRRRGSSDHEEEMNHECSGNQWHRVRVCPRRCTVRDVSSRVAPRTSSEYGFKRFREARDGTDCNDGGRGSRLADRLGKEFVRHAEKRIDAGLRQYHRARPPDVQLWAGDEGGP